jgi:hypothetical protein
MLFTSFAVILSVRRLMRLESVRLLSGRSRGDVTLQPTPAWSDLVLVLLKSSLGTSFDVRASFSFASSRGDLFSFYA